MVVRRRKKHLKFRGNRHQGYGSHKKHRGGGSRGGRGRAGLHKHKWSYVVKYEPDAFGKFGFKRPQDTLIEISAVNVRHLDEMAEKFLKMKLATKEGDSFKIDVTKLGFDKVLGSGKVTKKLVVSAKSFSEDAKKKLEEAGGEAVIVTKEAVAGKKEEPKEKAVTEKKKPVKAEKAKVEKK